MSELLPVLRWIIAAILALVWTGVVLCNGWIALRRIRGNSDSPSAIPGVGTIAGAAVIVLAPVATLYDRLPWIPLALLPDLVWPIESIAGFCYVRRRLESRLSSNSENKSLIFRYYDEMWNCWNFALADDLIAEDVAFRGSLGVTVEGRESFKDYMRQVQRAFPDFHNRIDDLIAEGDKVVACLTYTGTHQGELLGIAPTGRPVTYAGVAVFRIVEGRIADGRVLGDLYGLLNQLRDH